MEYGFGAVRRELEHDAAVIFEANAALTKIEDQQASLKTTADLFQKQLRAYQFRNEEDRYSKRVGMERIAEEGYNLNISRYISTDEQEVAIDLTATHVELIEIERQIRESTAKHNAFLKELGLSLLPGKQEE